MCLTSKSDAGAKWRNCLWDMGQSGINMCCLKEFSWVGLCNFDRAQATYLGLSHRLGIYVTYRRAVSSPLCGSAVPTSSDYHYNMVYSVY